ncbi:MAG: 3-dehydroquinate synthase, partial [Candidatus Limivicinus sp.]
MKTIRISASGEYDVIIAPDLLSSAGERIRAAVPDFRKAAVITDDNVAPLLLSELERSLAGAGIESVRYIFPHGEGSKNGENYLKILSFLASSRLSRGDIVIALGGGVVGDIAGFAAATYLRGIRYVQLPTSLLAMVDSSVGGKTAIDLEEGKNLAGAFCQPELVLCDLDALKTLSPEFFTDGCAEIFKYGVLGDRELFDHLCRRGQNFDREYAVSRSVEMKRGYVSRDEFDRGLRQMLNLGHTVGHAIEKCSGYREGHGRAVAAGLAVIAKACAENGICSRRCAGEIISGLEALGLPTGTGCSAEELMTPMLADKKRSGDKINL